MKELNATLLKCSRRVFFAALLLAFAHALGSARAAEVSKEYQLKAVLLWRLAQYVDWPGERFENAESPIIIGIVGQNPFGSAVEIATRGETAHGRPIVVRYFADLSELQDCHVLFISKSESSRVRSIVSRAMKKGAVLTVSDMEDFVRTEGGMVRFTTEQNKVGLVINLESTKEAGLAVDARLLRIAQVVKK